jgi:hypothetical protein
MNSEDPKTIDQISDDIGSACVKCGEFSIGEVKLDEPDSKLLDISDSNLGEHVAMQPSAIAYYGYMLKTATRNLDCLNRDFALQQKRWHSSAKISLMVKTPKPTVGDIDSYVAINFETEINEWNSRIDRAQSTVDQLSVWYDAWRQKGFNLRGYLSVTDDERRSSGGGADSIKETTAQGIRRAFGHNDE